MTAVGYKQRIRAVIQNLNEAFAKELAKAEHFRVIGDFESTSNLGASLKPRQVTRDEF